MLKRTSHGEGSFEYPQHMFCLRKKKIIVIYVLLSGGFELYTGDALAKLFDLKKILHCTMDSAKRLFYFLAGYVGLMLSLNDCFE